jgi:hypothetical protein
LWKDCPAIPFVDAALPGGAPTGSGEASVSATPIADSSAGDGSPADEGAVVGDRAIADGGLDDGADRAALVAEPVYR